DYTHPRQTPIMCAELPRVLADDIVLISVVLKYHQIRHAANNPHLPDLLLEAQEEHNTVILLRVHALGEVALQIGLLVTTQPPRVTLTIIRNTFIQAVKHDALLFLHK